MSKKSNPDKELSEYEELRKRNMADVQSKYSKLLKDLGKEPKAKKPKTIVKEIRPEFYRSYELRKRGKTVNYSENEPRQNDFVAKKDRICVDKNSNVPKSSKYLMTKLIPCPKCDKKFSLKSSLGQHLDQKHSGFRHQCQSCLRSFVLSSDLGKHLIKCKKSNMSNSKPFRSFSHQHFRIHILTARWSRLDQYSTEVRF